MNLPSTPFNDRNTDPLLSVGELRTHFPVHRGLLGRISGHVRAVDGVSLEIARGTTLGLVGESGCGKTTLGRTIVGLERATGGWVRFDGVDVLAARGAALAKLRREMQTVFQDTTASLNPRMAVGRSVAEPLVIHGIANHRERRTRVAELLKRVGLHPSDAAKYPHQFSGGQRQRIGIARAIALTPKLLICDEPVSALDVSIQSQVLNLLNELKEEFGLTCLFIAHNLAVIGHICDRIAVMYLGKIVEIGDATDIFDNPRHPYTIALLGAQLEPGVGRKTPRIKLAGETPSSMEPPSGCALHPRCPLATDLCRRAAPPLDRSPASSAGHLAACHHAAIATSPANEHTR